MPVAVALVELEPPEGDPVVEVPEALAVTVRL